ncbi:MAG: homoserine dehydrogenase [Candidatus Omnitrophica bacterium]|nr:homoserine dehydrogenase [Candidatus Omnitrophota bacterium]
MRKINLGIIGFGNVGAGVIKILREKKSLLSEKIGIEINVKKVCDKDIISKRNVSVDKALLTRNPKDILDDPQIDIVVELVGGINPAKEFITSALNKGKHVVTANKALLAQDGQELLSLADDRGKNIYFEASVGAGIPIIKSVREGLVANNFKSVYGIVNGTSNFILSRMSENNCTFNQALKEAQEKGFAEKDPTLDIEGIDSCHKLVLLTYLCFGRFIKISDVFVEGISKISTADVCYANEIGLQIKLLAIAKKEGNDLEVRVHPTLIPKSSLLASVSGVFNAIYVDSDLAGDLLFYGPGSGQLIVQDKTIRNLRSTDDFESRYYIRFMALDKPGVLAKISGVLAKFGISIASVTQKEHRKAHVVPIVMIIHQAKEKNLRLALAAISRLDVIKEAAVAIRMEEI